jgi:hypothetical protein
VSYVMVMYNQVKQCKCTIGNMIHANYILHKEKSTLKDLSNDNCDDKMWNCGVPMTKQLKLHSKMKWLTIIEWYQTHLICLLNKNHILVYCDWKSYVKWWGMYGYNQTMNFWNPHNQLMDLWKLAKMQYKSCYS